MNFVMLPGNRTTPVSVMLSENRPVSLRPGTDAGRVPGGTVSANPRHFSNTLSAKNGGAQAPLYIVLGAGGSCSPGIDKSQAFPADLAIHRDQ